MYYGIKLASLAYESPYPPPTHRHAYTCTYILARPRPPALPNPSTPTYIPTHPHAPHLFALILQRIGRGTLIYTNGEAEVGTFEEGRRAGEGARWSADRQTAWRMKDGKEAGCISLEDASEIASAIDLPVPGPNEESVTE